MGALTVEQWRARIGGFKPPGCSKTRKTSGCVRSKNSSSRCKLSLTLIVFLVYANVSHHVVSRPVFLPATPADTNSTGNF